MIRLLLTCFVSLFFSASGARAATSFQDIDTQTINAGLGTIEFRARLLKDISADTHNHDFLLAVSSDSSERYDILINQRTIIARRYFSGCLVTAFSAPYPFAPGEWHAFRLAWNKATTKFYVDGKEIQKTGPLSSDDLPKLIPCIRLGRDDTFELDDLRILNASDIREDEADRSFAEHSSCPRLDELFAESPQEEYRGIALRHFPDQKSRDKIKEFIALLPEDFAQTIRHVAFVENDRSSKSGEGGSADLDTMGIVLKEAYYDDPSVFFHEAAHLYDYKLRIATGVPEEKNEWAAISKEFEESFRKPHVQSGFLGRQGGQRPPEDLAEWAAAVYDFYIRHKTFADYLDPTGPRYSAKNKLKLDFLLSEGFFSQEMYDKVTAK